MIEQASASQVKLVPGQNKPNVGASNQGKFVVVQSTGSGQAVRVNIHLAKFFCIFFHSFIKLLLQNVGMSTIKTEMDTEGGSDVRMDTSMEIKTENITILDD